MLLIENSITAMEMAKFKLKLLATLLFTLSRAKHLLTILQVHMDNQSPLLMLDQLITSLKFLDLALTYPRPLNFLACPQIIHQQEKAKLHQFPVPILL